MTIYSELAAALTQAKVLAQALNALNRTKRHSGDLGPGELGQQGLCDRCLALRESIRAHEVWRNCTNEAAWYAPEDDWKEEE